MACPGGSVGPAYIQPEGKTKGSVENTIATPADADRRLPEKKVLTDRALKALKPARAGKRYIIWDAQQPHLGVRVTDNATVTDATKRMLTVGPCSVAELAAKLSDESVSVLDHLHIVRSGLYDMYVTAVNAGDRNGTAIPTRGTNCN